VLEVDIQENISKESRDISVLLLYFPCKAPSYLAYHIHAPILCRQWTYSYRCGVSGKSL